jgi:hypothetical protein
MRTEISKKIGRLGLCGALLLLAASCFAQTKEGDLVADIPFAFVVAGRTLPPGHYVINRLNENLAIHADRNQVVLVPTHSAQRPAGETSSKMVFHHYADTYFLEEVWVGSNSIGRALFPSRAEQKLKQSGMESEIASVGLGK